MAALSEREKYERLWEVDDYRLRSPGLKQVDHFLTVCAPEKHETILDVGCGTGKATHKLRELGYEAYGVDLAYNAMETNDRDEVVDYLMVGDYTEMRCEYDWIFCCDMLEHLPNSQLEPTLKKIARESAKGFYLQVPTFPDHGKQWEEDCDFVLHHTVKDAAWWAETFRAVFGEDVDIIQQQEGRRVICWMRTHSETP